MSSNKKGSSNHYSENNEPDIKISQDNDSKILDLDEESQDY